MNRIHLLETHSEQGANDSEIHSMLTVRLAVSELELGMHVVELDRPWHETPFLLQGFIIETPSDLAVVQQYCRYVVVEVEQPFPQVETGNTPSSQRSPRAPAQRRREPPPPPAFSFRRLLRSLRDDEVETTTTPHKPVTQQLKATANTHRETSRLLRSMMDDVRLGNAINTTAMRLQVRDCVSRLLDNPDAMMWLVQLKAKDERSASHSLNVCLLAVAFGRHLGLPADEIETLGLAALLHDIGKILLPAELLNRRDDLSAAERKQLRLHPELGQRVLMAAKGVPGRVIDVAYNHHEQVDGRGYPRGLLAERIPPWAKLVAVVDAYEAMTSTHYYREAIPHDRAIAQLRIQAGVQLDATLVNAFIAMIGSYPVGSIVALDNGEIAVVIAAFRERPAHPKVLIVRDRQQRPCPQRVLLLDDTSTPSICGMMCNGAFDIDIAELLRKGLRLRVD